MTLSFENRVDPQGEDKHAVMQMPEKLELQASQCNVENQTNVFHLCPGKVFEDGNQIEKLVIVGVREPAADGYRVLGMEYI